MPIDYKKKEKALYQPTTTPGIVHVPDMLFLQIDGSGNPNDPEGAYPSAVEILYTVSYAIKMMPKNGSTPPGYFDYVVPPLEGLWWLNDNNTDFSNKSKFQWTSMIRQPEFVSEDVFSAARQVAQKKKPHLDMSLLRLAVFEEGTCVQCMHIGTFDDEPRTLALMDRFMEENGWRGDISDQRRHHEIYLSDPRKTAPEKMKTILRHPVRKA